MTFLTNSLFRLFQASKQFDVEEEMTDEDDDDDDGDDDDDDDAAISANDSDRPSPVPEVVKEEPDAPQPKQPAEKKPKRGGPNFGVVYGGSSRAAKLRR